MNTVTNSLGQIIGRPVVGWEPKAPLQRVSTHGRYCRIQPINVDDHASDLFEAYRTDKEGRIWTYLPYGPFASEPEFRAWMAETCLGSDPLFHVIIDLKSGKAAGMASYLRIQREVGVIEIGHINYSPILQRTPIATEAMYMLMRWVFVELGYRRYEWKCDALNAASCSAAVRYGFSYDGLFEQATIYKGRNRDTAWYSILDYQWPQLSLAYRAWLVPENFDEKGNQKTSLRTLTALALEKTKKDASQ